MKLVYFGHAAVGLEAPSGERLIVDPYETGALGGAIRYEPILWSGDYVVCTHGHDDHSAVDALASGSLERIDEGEAGPFAIRRYPFDHDEYGGERFGGRVDALEIRCDDVRIVHGADIGQSPRGALPPGLKEADVAVLPTGGFYTIGAAQAREWTRRLRPTAVVPVHYATPDCDLPLHPLENFLIRSPAVAELGGSTVRIPEEIGSREGTALPLEPACATTTG